MTAKQLTISMLVIVSALYLAAACGYWWAGRQGMAVAFLGYVAANAGFIWDSM